MSINVENVLRNLPTDEKIFKNTKRVKVIKAVDCIVALSKLGLESQEIKDEIQALLAGFKLFKVRVSQNNSSRVEPAFSKVVNANDYYMWAQEPYDYKNLILGLAIIFFILAISMFTLWPTKLKRTVFLVRYPLYALLGAALGISAIRLIVFAITFFIYPNGLWLLPNLWEDCGFFESFVPAYSWANEDVSHKKD